MKKTNTQKKLSKKSVPNLGSLNSKFSEEALAESVKKVDLPQDKCRVLKDGKLNGDYILGGIACKPKKMNRIYKFSDYRIPSTFIRRYTRFEALASISPSYFLAFQLELENFIRRKMIIPGSYEIENGNRISNRLGFCSIGNLLDILKKIKAVRNIDEYVKLRSEDNRIEIIAGILDLENRAKEETIFPETNVEIEMFLVAWRICRAYMIAIIDAISSKDTGDHVTIDNLELDSEIINIFFDTETATDEKEVHDKFDALKSKLSEPFRKILDLIVKSDGCDIFID